jgi:hypothetical protein
MTVCCKLCKHANGPEHVTARRADLFNREGHRE